MLVDITAMGVHFAQMSAVAERAVAEAPVWCRHRLRNRGTLSVAGTGKTGRSANRTGTATPEAKRQYLHGCQ
jgi:hypothetical protein